MEKSIKCCLLMSILPNILTLSLVKELIIGEIIISSIMELMITCSEVIVHCWKSQLTLEECLLNKRWLYSSNSRRKVVTKIIKITVHLTLVHLLVILTVSNKLQLVTTNNKVELLLVLITHNQLHDDLLLIIISIYQYITVSE